MVDLRSLAGTTCDRKKATTAAISFADRGCFFSFRSVMCVGAAGSGKRAPVATKSAATLVSPSSARRAALPTEICSRLTTYSSTLVRASGKRASRALSTALIASISLSTLSDISFLQFRTYGSVLGSRLIVIHQTGRSGLLKFAERADASENVCPHG